MNVDEFIEEIDKRTDGRNPLVEEMRYYNDHPESLISGDMYPNFDNVDDREGAILYSWYVGVMFGIGIANKHDINESDI